MAKITVHGGATHASEPPVRIRRAMLGGESKSAGNSSEKSIKSKETSGETSDQSPQLPAPMTENLSNQEQPPDNSTARLTGGHGQTTKSGKKKAKKATTSSRTVNADEFD